MSKFSIGNSKIVFEDKNDTLLIHLGDNTYNIEDLFERVTKLEERLDNNIDDYVTWF